MAGEITQSRLRDVLRYDPATGEFAWLIRPSIGIKVGDIAGTIDGRGYVRIGIDGAIYRAHRLAWLFVFGSWPSQEVDHINGDKADNRIANLRDATRALNQQNQRGMRSTTGSGLLGVSRHTASGKWRARIWTEGRNKSLGLFATADEAHIAYVAAKRELHEGCTL